MNKKRFLYLCIGVVLGIFCISKYPNHPSLDIRLPVNFSHSLLEPIVNIEIEGTKYSVFIDLGSVGYEFHLEDRILKKIKNKKALGVGEFSDLRGNLYSCPEFCIPEIKLGEAAIFNSTVTERNHRFLHNAHVWPISNTQRLIDEETSRIDGKIGLPVFQNYNCLFDFPNSVIILQKDIEDLEKIYPPNKFVRTPFSIEKYGIVLSIETDAGIHRVVLDTGATVSVIKKSIITPVNTKEVEEEYYSTNKLIIEGCDYGAWELAQFDISEKWDVDGCLGADFFVEHAVYLDFHNKMAYIQRPEKFALLTQWKRFKFRATQLYRKMV